MSIPFLPGLRLPSDLVTAELDREIHRAWLRRCAQQEHALFLAVRHQEYDQIDRLMLCTFPDLSWSVASWVGDLTSGGVVPDPTSGSGT